MAVLGLLGFALQFSFPLIHHLVAPGYPLGSLHVVHHGYLAHGAPVPLGAGEHSSHSPYEPPNDSPLGLHDCPLCHLVKSVALNPPPVGVTGGEPRSELAWQLWNYEIVGSGHFRHDASPRAPPLSA